MKQPIFVIDLRSDDGKGMYVFTMQEPEDAKEGKYPDNYYWNDTSFSNVCGPFTNLWECTRNWTKARQSLKSFPTNLDNPAVPSLFLLPKKEGKVINVDFKSRKRF